MKRKKNKNKIAHDQRKTFYVPNLLTFEDFSPDLYNHNLTTLPTKKESMEMLAVAFNNGLPLLLNNAPQMTSFFNLETLYNSLFENEASNILPSTTSPVPFRLSLNAYFCKETFEEIEEQIPITLDRLIKILCFLETFVIDSFSCKTYSQNIPETINLIVCIRLKTSETLYARLIFTYSSYEEYSTYEYWHWCEPVPFLNVDYEAYEALS